jgi:hypothetical protein
MTLTRQYKNQLNSRIALIFLALFLTFVASCPVKKLLQSYAKSPVPTTTTGMGTNFTAATNFFTHVAKDCCQQKNALLSKITAGVAQIKLPPSFPILLTVTFLLVTLTLPLLLGLRLRITRTPHYLLQNDSIALFLKNGTFLI